MPQPWCKQVLIDCDGVLTDGRLTIDHKGEKLFKQFHTRDVRAIRELVLHGMEVTIVTADDWAGIDYFADKVGALVQKVRDKSEVKVEDPFIAIGDDAWDVPLLKRAAISFCPRDADYSVRYLPGVRVLDCSGGQGVVAEFLRYLVNSLPSQLGKML